MRKHRLTNAATQDIREIRIYSREMFGVRVTEDYIRGLRDVFALLRDRPFIGRTAERFGDGVRVFTYRSHRILYEAGEEQLLVVRILHHAREVVGDPARD